MWPDSIYRSISALPPILLNVFSFLDYTLHWSISMRWDYVSELLPQTDILFIPTWYVLEKDGGMILAGETEELGEKPVPVPLCPPQIPHGLTWARTRASAVRSRRLTTWAMARPSLYACITTYISNISNRRLVNVNMCNMKADTRLLLILISMG
jgi:hypothetical protein